MSVLSNLIHEREEWANGHDKQLARRKAVQSVLYYVYIGILIVMAFNINRIIDFVKSL